MNRAHLLSIAVVALLAIPAGAHAAHERSETLRAERELESFTQRILPIAEDVAGERRVVLNGATTYFRKSTDHGTVDEVLSRVAAECASGTQAKAFGLTKDLDDGAGKPLRLERVVTQRAENGAAASLCIFANDGGSPNETHRVRWTLAAPRDDGSIAVSTVVNASSTPLEEMFPAEGDAPGSDAEGVARPEHARRTLTAIVGKGEHVVRVYESDLPLADSIASYDRAMHGLGFATTGTLDDARMYRKDGKSWAVSFRATTGGSSIALLPFGSAPSD